MADEKDLEIEEGGGGKKKLMMIIGAVVLIGGGAGAYFFMGGDAPAGEEAAQEETLAEGGAESAADSGAAAPAADYGTALYVGMPRPFVFNIPGASRDRLVQIKVQLLVRGDESEEICKRHIPLIEGTLLQTFSGTNADDLGTPEGKDSLREKSLADVQKALIDVAGNKVVERILFTGLVMQ